jgi:hypothetical protein
VRNAERNVEEERLARLLFVQPIDGLLEHERLVFDWLDMGDNFVLLDNRPDVAGVGESVEVVEAERVGSADHFRADGHFPFGARFSIHPIHPEVPFTDARGGVAVFLEQ